MMSLTGGTVDEIQKSTTNANAQFQRTENGLCLIVCVTPASLGILSTLLYKTAHGTDGFNKRGACPIVKHGVLLDNALTCVIINGLLSCRRGCYQ